MPKRLRCVVPGCEEQEDGVVLFQFPKNDLNCLREWLQACGDHQSFEDFERARICSLHFQEDDFVKDVRNELLNLPQRKLLKPDAVPSINLHRSCNVNIVICDRLDSVSQGTVRPLNHSQNLENAKAIRRKRKLTNLPGASNTRKTTCCVANCLSQAEVTYHKIPREPDLRQLWLDAFKRKQNINLKTALVCEQHFTPEDFANDVRHELLNLPLRKILRPGAVPSQNLVPPDRDLPNDWNLEWIDEGVNIITTAANDADQVEIIGEFAELIEFDHFDASTCTDIETLRSRISQLERFILVQNNLIESLRTSRLLKNLRGLSEVKV